MIEKAIAKINIEVLKAPEDTYRAVIGEYIIDHILTTEDAERVLNENKTLEKALNEIVSKARKQAKGGKAFVEDGVVFGWAMEYFGLQDENSPNPQTSAEKREEKPSKKGIALVLENFFS
ncbi:PcfK-like protein [anaerobic digester metagenome]